MLASGSATAKTLRVAYYSGAAHPMIESGINVFMDEVRKADSSIDFRVFPAGQLGKPGDSVKGLQSGLADISQIVVTYHREELPLSNVINLPWKGADAWSLSNAFMRATLEPGPIRDEWERNGLVAIMSVTNAPYEIHTPYKPLPNLASLSGIKMRSPGGSYDEIIKLLGAVPVSMPIPESFEALQRSTIDATLYSFSNWSGLRLQEIIKHTTTNVALPAASGLTFAMSKRAFDSLTPKQQAIVIEAGRTASLKSQSVQLQKNEDALKEFVGNGLKTYEWPEADLNTLDQRLADIKSNWIKAMDEAKRPGSQAAADMAKFLEAASASPKDIPMRTK
jgi:TRAP-type C4-dicarboxylate transport system substrate-binding protein